MIEDEARKRWCPFARVPTWAASVPSGERASDIVAVNRLDHLDSTIPRWPAACACIASDCMAWRWRDFHHASPEPREGHCGLAGKP